jgi:hypothetical protein
MKLFVRIQLQKMNYDNRQIASMSNDNEMRTRGVKCKMGKCRSRSHGWWKKMETVLAPCAASRNGAELHAMRRKARMIEWSVNDAW